jgi:enoyl-CoA hydratase
MAALQAIRDFPVPVVAVLNGDARGGGAELALACDFRIAAATAHIGFIQGRLNISTAWGGGTDLVNLLGSKQALSVLCRSELLSAGVARTMGLIDVVADASELARALDEFLQPLLNQKPQVLRAFKALANAGRAGQSQSALQAVETGGLVKTWTHEDHWEAASRVLGNTNNRSSR